MKEADIRRYAELMKELELTGLEITQENTSLRLERKLSGLVRESAVVQQETAAEAAGLTQKEKDISMKSPLVGVFYAAAAENATPYVSLGDRVTKGQTLCVIEAMKLMNEITAQEDGTIAEICVQNGQIVEYGTELFRIRR